MGACPGVANAVVAARVTRVDVTSHLTSPKQPTSPIFPSLQLLRTQPRPIPLLGYGLIMTPPWTPPRGTPGSYQDRQAKDEQERGGRLPPSDPDPSADPRRAPGLGRRAQNLGAHTLSTAPLQGELAGALEGPWRLGGEGRWKSVGGIAGLPPLLAWASRELFRPSPHPHPHPPSRRTSRYDCWLPSYCARVQGASVQRRRWEDD